MGRLLAWAVVLAWVVACEVATRDRVALWSSPDPERALWDDAVGHAPHKPRPWVNLGNAYLRAGAPELAEDAYRTAVAVAPGRPYPERVLGRALAQTNWALVRWRQGDRAGALALLDAALAEYPRPVAARTLREWIVAQDSSSSFSSF